MRRHFLRGHLVSEKRPNFVPECLHLGGKPKIQRHRIMGPRPSRHGTRTHPTDRLTPHPPLDGLLHRSISTNMTSMPSATQLPSLTPLGRGSVSLRIYPLDLPPREIVTDIAV